jgi:hypothetical protein
MTTPPEPENMLRTGMAIWAAAGPLVGVLIGAYIANRNQRRQWVGNCKKEEYRELISVLTKALSTYLRFHSFGVAGPEDQRSQADALDRVEETTRDRIFIAPVVKRLGVIKRWHAATTLIEGGGDINAFANSVGILLDEIRDAAIKDIGA